MSTLFKKGTEKITAEQVKEGDILVTSDGFVGLNVRRVTEVNFHGRIGGDTQVEVSHAELDGYDEILDVLPLDLELERVIGEMK